MRLSTDPTDAGFLTWNDARSRRIKPIILLDGRQITSVVMADDEVGELLVQETDAAGKPILSPDRSRILQKPLRGRVTIILAEHVTSS